jgi:hypothetical protein
MMLAAYGVLAQQGAAPFISLYIQRKLALQAGLTQAVICVDDRHTWCRQSMCAHCAVVC